MKRDALLANVVLCALLGVSASGCSEANSGSANSSTSLGTGGDTGTGGELTDGNTGTGPSPTHLYETAGEYTVTLTVTDVKGATKTTTSTITVPTSAWVTYYSSCSRVFQYMF